MLGYCHLCGSSPTLGEGCHCQEPAAGVAPTMCTHLLSKRVVGAATKSHKVGKYLVTTIVDKRTRGAAMDAYK